MAEDKKILEKEGLGHLNNRILDKIYQKFHQVVGTETDTSEDLTIYGTRAYIDEILKFEYLK